MCCNSTFLFSLFCWRRLGFSKWRTPHLGPHWLKHLPKEVLYLSNSSNNNNNNSNNSCHHKTSPAPSRPPTKGSHNPRTQWTPSNSSRNKLKRRRTDRGLSRSSKRGGSDSRSRLRESEFVKNPSGANSSKRKRLSRGRDEQWNRNPPHPPCRQSSKASYFVLAEGPFYERGKQIPSPFF